MLGGKTRGLVHGLMSLRCCRTKGNTPVVTAGYGHDPYEREAYNFTADILELHGCVLCQ